MGKWLNGARVRKREIDGKDTIIAALAAANASATKKDPVFSVSFSQNQKTDTEAKLIVGVGVRTDNNSGAVTFAITT